MENDNIDFSQYDSIGNERATIAIAHIEDAIKLDMQAQGRKYVKSKFGRWVDATYGLSNKTAIRYGGNIGRALLRGDEIAKTRAMVKGSDFAKIVYYALDKEGNSPWINLRKKLREIGFHDLAEIQKSVNESVAEHVHEAVQRFDYTTVSVASQLKQLAEKIEPIERQRNEYFKKVQQQNLTIVSQATELSERNELIEQLQRQLDRLRTGIKNEKDPKKSQEMVKTLDKMLKMFEDLK